METNPIQFDLPDDGRDRARRAAGRAETDRALQEGARLRPEWLSRFIGWWAAAATPLAARCRR
ncbi:hypothetical protein GCM10009854_00130 [Saccharopolyspora halophila]|uniref:Uncharacterized protein n=1 Tax=Saccharopolyspora halophila TaxID=405551 RepID=A0ABN3FFP7_9PSEU